MFNSRFRIPIGKKPLSGRFGYDGRNESRDLPFAVQRRLRTASCGMSEIETIHRHETAGAEKKTARWGLVVYFAVLIVGSAVVEFKILQTGEPIEKVPGLILTLIYIPSIASIVARLVLREGFGDISLRWGGSEGRRAASLGLVYPIAVGFVAYGIAWSMGLAQFRLPLSPRSHLYADSAVMNLTASFFIGATLG